MDDQKHYKEIWQRCQEAFNLIYADDYGTDRQRLYRERGVHLLAPLVQRYPYDDIKQAWHIQGVELDANEIFFLALAGCGDCEGDVRHILNSSENTDDRFDAALTLCILSSEEGFDALTSLCEAYSEDAAYDVRDQLDGFIQLLSDPRAKQLAERFIDA